MQIISTQRDSNWLPPEQRGRKQPGGCPTVFQSIIQSLAQITQQLSTLAQEEADRVGATQPDRDGQGGPDDFQRVPQPESSRESHHAQKEKETVGRRRQEACCPRR